MRQHKDLRSFLCSVRFTEAERTVLTMRAQAAGHDELATYARAVLMRNAPPKERKVPAVNFDTWGKLGKLTRVLEELETYLHVGNGLDAEQGEELAQVLRALSAEIGDVRVLLLGGTAEDIAG